jgi:acyl-coenzyme A thioesterase PaaI-like protein
VLRELADASIRTEVDAAEVERAVADLQDVLGRLRKRQLDGSYGLRHSKEGGGTRPWGNAVVGVRNPVAPPLDVRRDPAGQAEADFRLGAAYEGPPGLVHGGVSALVLDQLLGEAAGAGGKPGMTATLTISYRRPTPLGDLHAKAWITRVEDHKTWAVGHIADAEGVTVEAEGLFILPRWARGPRPADAGADDAEPAEAQRPDRFE